MVFLTLANYGNDLNHYQVTHPHGTPCTCIKARFVATSFKDACSLSFSAWCNFDSVRLNRIGCTSCTADDDVSTL